ncbi:hypothetical protein C9374_013656 [Naegleria lovaniensis]|uniref:Uncharacterized protein n=1 Tax=Naegleria lovaniensis TaxID=51637 RepID=A0AA88G9L2_NAELO|nr:uncharacterized protein C9374_013656 [Naegleria lovaniensis]KAG2372701.1 hypothetical protein C9374_013656 [Naegleria lovaniensis]
MKLRIVSNLISQVLLRINSPSLWEIIETRISKLYHCSQFQFRNTEAEEDDECKGDQFLPQLPYLNGNQANVILFNFETVFDGIFDYMEIMIWLLTRVILFQYVEGVDTLKGNVQAKSRLEILCKWLCKLLIEKYPTSKFAFYFHILIVQIPELIFLFVHCGDMQTKEVKIFMLIIFSD